MTTTTTGRCAACGQPFTTARHQRPRRRFCSDRCRKTDWEQTRAALRRHPSDVVARPDVVPRPPDVVLHPAVPNDVVAPSGARDLPRCPHCTRPIAVINLLVVPAAAQVPTPGARHG